MLKKLTLALMIVCLAFSALACANNEETSDGNNNSNPTQSQKDSYQPPEEDEPDVLEPPNIPEDLVFPDKT